MMVTRREFMKAVAGAAGALALAGCESNESLARAPGGPSRPARGIVLLPSDLSLADWPDRAQRAGLNTIALHAGSFPSRSLLPFVESRAGGEFFDRCAALGLHVEYQFHAASELLPRDLFSKDPTLFRSGPNCERYQDGNFCVHSPTALAIVAENAVKLARRLRPTTHRYYFWGDDDGQWWCRCPCCAPLSDSDQALVYENALLDALRAEDPLAEIAHLAYGPTLEPPVEVTPREGVFLQLAPCCRRFDVPLVEDPQFAVVGPALDANLKRFPSNPMVLDFWLDASALASWQGASKQKLTVTPAVIAADIAFYRSRGIRDIFTFGAWLDSDYVGRFGEPPIDEYGAAFAAT